MLLYGNILGIYDMTKILCIEDDTLQRQEIVDALTTEGFEVLEGFRGFSLDKRQTFRFVPMFVACRAAIHSYCTEI